jgi:TetR/AcrR family transcriptional regulator, lmrAB and yxaGH operons repressor
MSETRQRMIELGAQLLRRQGYHATTLVQVVDEGNLPRGSIYHHFPNGKSELALAAIQFGAAEADADMTYVNSRATSARHAIEIYFMLLADRLEASGYIDGCWYAATALDVAPANAPISDALSTEFRRWESAIETGLQTWGIEAQHAAVCASLLIATVEGALLRARIDRSVTAMKALIPLIQNIVEPRH